MGSDAQKALKGEIGGIDLEPTGAYESFTGGDRAEPIDFAANPIGSYMAYKGGNDVMDLGRMGGRAMAGWGAGVGLSAAGAGAGATTPTTGSEVGGLQPSADAAGTLGSGTGSSVPSSGLRYSGSEQVLGQPSAANGATGPMTGSLNPSPAAMDAFNAGTNLPFATQSGIMAGGEGMAFNAGSASPGGTAPAAPQQPGLRVGPNAANELGTAPTPTGGGAAGPAGGAPAPQQGGGVVNDILAQMKANAVPLGIMGVALAGAGRQTPMPTQQQLQGLSAEAQQTANQLLSQYRSGQLSAGQAASLDQLTRQTKNQITQYFASIGQADSTAHQQALAQVDAQALGMKQQMLDSMLQQGLQAIGVATGPLNSIAQYQMGQDQALRQAFGNFASAAGMMAGRSAGTPQPAPQQAAQTAASLRAPQGAPESMPLG